jgi:hypothetical protein
VTKPDDPIQSYTFFDPVTKLELRAGGLSKREWFAGLAMQGLFASGSSRPTTDAIHYADTLIKRLNEPTNKGSTYGESQKNSEAQSGKTSNNSQDNESKN